MHIHLSFQATFLMYILTLYAYRHTLTILGQTCIYTDSHSLALSLSPFHSQTHSEIYIHSNTTNNHTPTWRRVCILGGAGVCPDR